MDDLASRESSRRLLEAASEEFARHGYTGARIRTIVDAAQVNLAAVNYYFRAPAGRRPRAGILQGPRPAHYGILPRRPRAPARARQRRMTARRQRVAAVNADSPACALFHTARAAAKRILCCTATKRQMDTVF